MERLTTMTEDTARALAIIKPMADELNIRVRADGHCLFCNGQAIGIACNSTYATIMEFIGYLIFRWAKDKCVAVPRAMSERIKRYWYSEAQVEQFQKMREAALEAQKGGEADA